MLIKILYFFILLLYSCDFNREAIPVSNLNQDNLKYQKLLLNNSLSDTLMNTNEIGLSSLLYTGSLNDSDYVYSIFSFDSEIFNQYDLCDSDSLSFKESYIVLDIIKKYSSNDNQEINDNSNNSNDNISLDSPPFNAYWLNYSDFLDMGGNAIIDQDWIEDDIIMLDNIDLSSILTSFNSDNSKRLFVDFYLGKYYVNLSSKLINGVNDCSDLDESICNDGCLWSDNECMQLKDINICDINNEINGFLLLSSNPNLDLLYEIASSEYISDYSNTEPYLNVVYDEYEEVTKTSNKFIINNSSNYIGSSYFIADTSFNNYNSFYVSNFLNNQLEMMNNQEISDSVVWSNYDCENDDEVCLNSFLFIEGDSTLQEQKLIDIEIDLVNTNNFETYGINFWLDKIKYIEFKNDPNSDNWIDINNNQIWDENEGTENNLNYDSGEFYIDYGLDQCPDNYEDGNGGCLCEYPFIDCEEVSLIYNLDGSQNNNQYDFGENYFDTGIDGCLNDEEKGAVLNDDGTVNEELSWVCGICEPNAINDLDNDGLCDFDPNNDNYNIDPSGDDWNDINNNDLWDDNEGTENNNKWDNGEIFLDFGLDGISNNDIGFSDLDGTESNGLYDFYDLNNDGIQQQNEIGEPYFDYGSDALQNFDEINYNNNGTEQNNLWDNGEEYDDCGEDGVCDDQDISDDWNPDPNKDFWLDCGSDHICPDDEDYIEPDSNGTEKNSLWDNEYCSNANFYNQVDCEANSFQWYESEFSEGNSLWNDGELYEDYGIDQTKDEDELFIIDQKINILDTDTTYYDFINEGADNYPGYSFQEEDNFKLWISSIYKISDEKLNVEISYMNQTPITGIEFRLNHDIYSIDMLDWTEKKRNIAKVENSSYIKDASIFNNTINHTNNSLFMNYGYGVSSKLNFSGLDLLIDNAKQNGYTISESNSYLKIFMNKSEDFILKSNSYIINFNEIDTIGSKLLFSYFVPSNPDSIVVPIGNLLQNYINNVSNYNDGLVLSLESNQYPPLFNFNNILIDTVKSPVIQVYYFE